MSRVLLNRLVSAPVPYFGQVADSKNSVANISFALLSDQWISRLLAGSIRYDPAQVQTRWIGSAGETSRRYLTLLNEGRKYRFSSEASTKKGPTP
jgi:hypothetical protein